MTAAELLTHLQGRGVVLWADGDRLRYKAPRGVLTPRLRAELTKCRTEVLALLPQNNEFPSLPSLPLQPISRDEKLPLSYAQLGLWLTAQTTNHPPFNQPMAFLIDGRLNVALLERCLNEILRRHEILRTSCRVVGEDPVQVVMPTCTLPIQTVELRNLDPIERESAAVRYATDEAQQPFNLAHGPLLRAKVLRMDDQSYVFILTTHTFVADGYSNGILLRELGQLYEAFSKGEPSPLSENQIQFADYARWQRQMVREEHLTSELAFWKQRLKDSPSMLRWPFCNFDHTVLTYRGETKYFSLPADLTESIRKLSRGEGVTVFTTLLAALNTLLNRLTGQADLIVGTTVSNRNRSELEGLIGYFANNLLLRTQISGHMTFRELLQACHEVAANAFAHQDLPFEKLLEELSTDPEISTVPLPQVVFVLHDHASEEDLQLPGLSLKEFPVQRRAASRDLHLHLTNASGPLFGSLEYSTDLFDGGTIDRILYQFETLLKCVVSDPQQRLESLPFLNKAERDELIRAWNNGRTINETNKSLPITHGLKQGKQASELLPQTNLEGIVVSIWQDVLGLEKVGIHDNFFDLGGRSIHIIQVHVRLQKLLKKDIPIIDLFRYPTIHSLCQRYSREHDQQSSLRQSHNRAELLNVARERRMRARSRQ